MCARRILRHIAVVIGGVAQVHDALLLEGSATLQPNQDMFLAKYVFSWERSEITVGTVNLKVDSISPQTGRVMFLLFDDESGSYPDSRARTSFACDDKDLQTHARWIWDVPLRTIPISREVAVFEHIKPRWWYVALIECSGLQREVSYTIHLENSRFGFQHELSYDQAGLGALTIVAILYGAIAVAQGYSVFGVSSVSVNRRHALRLMVGIASFAAFQGAIIAIIETGLLTFTGKNFWVLYILRKYLDGASKFMLMAIALLLSKGKCVSQPLRSSDIWWVCKLVVPFSLACVSFEVWGETAASRMYSTDDIYDGWIGAVLIFVDLCFFCFYAFNLLNLSRKEVCPTHKDFYRIWAPLYSTIFLVLPFSAFLAILVSNVHRTVVMIIVTSVIHSLILAFLVAGLWPEQSNTIFTIDSVELAEAYGVQSDLLSSARA